MKTAGTERRTSGPVSVPAMNSSCCSDVCLRRFVFFFSPEDGEK